MEDFKVRLVEERIELLDKIRKLDTFLSKHDAESVVGKFQFAILNIQVDAMNTYLDCLITRLADLYIK